MPRAFTEEERAHVRQRLQKRAAELVARDGFRGTTIDRLVRAAGISKGAFYNFHPSKEALFLEMLQETERELREALLERARRPGEPPEVLRGVLQLLVDALAGHPLLRVLTDPEESAALFRGLPPGTMRWAREEDDRWFGALFAEMVERGVIGEAALPVLTATPRLIFAVFQGREWLDDDFDAVTATLVEALAGHLSRPAAGARPAAEREERR